MTISNIFSLTNGSTGNGATKAAIANAGKAVSDPAHTLFKQVKAQTAQTSAGSVVGDSVGISDLAQALTGRTAEFFSHMDDKSRGKLEELVKSGRVSVDEAVKGLQYWADQTSFMKAMGKVPLTQEEEESFREERDVYAKIEENNKVVAEQSRAVEKVSEEYASALENGGDLEEISGRLDRARQEQDAAMNELLSMGNEARASRGNGSAVFSRRFQVVAEVKAASGHPDGAVMYNPEDKKAADKLSDAGLGQVQLKGAITSYGTAVAARAG